MIINVVCTDEFSERQPISIFTVALLKSVRRNQRGTNYSKTNDELTGNGLQLFLLCVIFTKVTIQILFQYKNKQHE